MKIRSYTLSTADKAQNIDIGNAMPTVLSVCELNGELAMWVQLEENYPGSFNLDVDVIGTGASYETQGQYAGTAVMANGDTWHIFAKKNYIRADI